MGNQSGKMKIGSKISIATMGDGLRFLKTERYVQKNKSTSCGR